MVAEESDGGQSIDEETLRYLARLQKTEEKAPYFSAGRMSTRDEFGQAVDSVYRLPLLFIGLGKWFYDTLACCWRGHPSHNYPIYIEYYVEPRWR